MILAVQEIRLAAPTPQALLADSADSAYRSSECDTVDEARSGKASASDKDCTTQQHNPDSADLLSSTPKPAPGTLGLLDALLPSSLDCGRDAGTTSSHAPGTHDSERDAALGSEEEAVEQAVIVGYRDLGSSNKRITIVATFAISLAGLTWAGTVARLTAGGGLSV
jgi:hypothetical protein